MTPINRRSAVLATNAKFVPKRTYKDKLSIGSGRDQVDLHYFGVGHTNGDTFVVFPALRVMHTGDMFAWKALPYIDTTNGGSVVAHAETLGRASPPLKTSTRSSQAIRRCWRGTI